MSEFMFGITKKSVTKVVAKRLNAICIEQGGTGFTGPVSIPGNDNKGWFTGPNLGNPFDERLAKDVRRAVESAGLTPKLGW
jgi:hypothetical protein